MPFGADGLAGRGLEPVADLDELFVEVLDRGGFLGGVVWGCVQGALCGIECA